MKVLDQMDVGLRSVTYVKLSFLFFFILSPNKSALIFSVPIGTILGAGMSVVLIVLGFSS